MVLATFLNRGLSVEDTFGLPHAYNEMPSLLETFAQVFSVSSVVSISVAYL